MYMNQGFERLLSSRERIGIYLKHFVITNILKITLTFPSKEIRAFPLTKVAAICMMSDSTEYALDHPCFVKSSIHKAPPLKTKPFKTVGDTRWTNGGSKLKSLL